MTAHFPDITRTAMPTTTGKLWPGARYARLVEALHEWIGKDIYVSLLSFNGAFRKEGRPYRLQGISPFPSPRSHPFPPKRAYPHMLVLESLRPDGWPDAFWQNGVYHGGAVNLAHVGSITTRAFPQTETDWLFANLDLLSRYFGRPALSLVEQGLVPADVTHLEAQTLWLDPAEQRHLETWLPPGQ